MAALTLPERHLIESADRYGLTLHDGRFLLDGTDLDDRTQHVARGLVFAGLLRRNGTFVKVTTSGGLALADVS